MRGMNRMLLLLASALTAGGMAGCTQYYRPVSAREAAELDKAQRWVYPGDVRSNFAAYGNTTVAWTGLIVGQQIGDTGSQLTLDLLVKHHYYDWIIDHGAQREKFLLSAQGEGLFRAQWKFKAGTPREEIARHSPTGGMVVVYGTPSGLEGETILLKTTYIRLIDGQWVSIGLLNYGRTEKTPGT
jgi:hypothetical protein